MHKISSELFLHTGNRNSSLRFFVEIFIRYAQELLQIVNFF